MKYLPDLTRPKNEFYTLLMAAVLVLQLIAEWLIEQDLSTTDGVLAAVLGVSALVGRLKTIGAETAAELSDMTVDEVLDR